MALYPELPPAICGGPLIKRTLEYYRERAKKREHMARFVDRIGIENVRDALC